MYRRSQALEKLGRLDQAVLDLQRCLSLEPKSRVFQEALRNIGGQIQEKVGGLGRGCEVCRVDWALVGSDMDSDVPKDALQVSLTNYVLIWVFLWFYFLGLFVVIRSWNLLCVLPGGCGVLLDCTS